MIDLDVHRVEEILDKYILARGIERTIMQIIFPFLEKIGILWITNHINPAQEHLVSNIIRQKLIVGIESIAPPIRKNKSVLLFLPEGEYHEIGLLFVHYLLKIRGVQVIYLGANISPEDITYVIQYTQPDYLYTHLTCVAQGFNFDGFVRYFSTRVKQTPLIISGKLSQTYTKRVPNHIHMKKSFSEVREFIAAL
jgi:methanogenic corrinoid protein MtbC1